MKYEENYISLQKATKYCSHSQEYLSLRARQRRLRAIKFGRNWLTKKEWLEEYLAKSEEYKNNLKVKKVETKKEILPPENLPVGEFDEREFAEIISSQIKEIMPAFRPVEKIRISSTGFRFVFAAALIFLLIIVGGVLGKKSARLSFETVNPYVENFDRILIGNIRDGVSQTAEGISLSIVDSQSILRNMLNG